MYEFATHVGRDLNVALCLELRKQSLELQMRTTKEKECNLIAIADGAR